MGLDCSHDAWHGAYGAFMTWREEIARLAEIPPLMLMDGFYAPLDSGRHPSLYHGPNTMNADTVSGQRYMDRLDSLLPISWESLKESPLHELLHHSDCDGEIAPESCKAIADELKKLVPKLPKTDHWGHIGSWKEKTNKFINGLNRAAEANEPLEFR